jgi:hypothetical protein
MLDGRCRLAPGSDEAIDPHYHLACKARIYRGIHEAAHTASFEVEDGEPSVGEIHWLVCVEERDSQRARSTPIWVREDGDV